ncbi:saccharopine dehydrogenase family protein [Synergistes jonesii]|uniref:saccharopine dehydrogenase family protein n=1 Tax=Synergistes jonesii TaxID=2754 RepID=UPI00242CCCA7|nr:saccharopine dehydrogenase C-terminal domain-containing protein [Synergistes jonesii]
MAYVYGVLGGGRQGTAAAYDMAKWGDAEKVIIGDISLEAAQKSAKRVNDLLGKEIAFAQKVDATKHADLVKFLTPIDSFLSAIPYWNNLKVAKAALEAKSSMCDLGGNTDIVKEQVKANHEWEMAGIAMVPDCGQVPGMGAAFTTYVVGKFDRCDEIMMWDGGNDLNPKPPFNYVCTFNIAGLTNEYYGKAYFLKDGKLDIIPTFREEDYETVEFPAPIGKMEAFVAGGGTSTMPWYYEGKLKTLWNKTLRWPGHYRQWKAYMDAGLLEEEPIEVKGQMVSPRDVFHAVIDPRIRATDEDKDFVIVRVLGRGIKDGKKAEFLLDLIDYYDEATGFTAMQRTTGWDASVTAIMNAKGITPRGAHNVEAAVPGELFVEELKKRGFNIQETFKFI